MRDDDGRKLDHRTLEEMRLRAVAAVQSGVHPKDVAAAFGMARGTVYGWLAKYRAGGREALAAKPVPGRRPELSDAQVRRIYTLVTEADPCRRQVEFPLWTRDRVRMLIHQECGVALSSVSAGRLLCALGLSPPRPLWRAWRISPEKVARWKTEHLPAIRSKARKEGAAVYFAGIGRVCPEFSPASAHPAGAAETTDVSTQLNLIFAVSSRGLLRFSTFRGYLTAALFVEFCGNLLDDTEGPIHLIVDGRPAHHGEPVSHFVASTRGRLRLYTLPTESDQRSAENA